MDINTLRSIITVLMMISFTGVCFWAFSRKRKTSFDEAAQLPFDDELQHQQTVNKKQD